MAEKPPRGDTALQQWCGPFSTHITATPTIFGLVAADATAFASLLTAFTSALATSSNPTTRTRDTIELKNQAKIGLRQKALELMRKINATPTVTDAQRFVLGMNPRDAEPTPIPAPSSRPLIRVRPDGTVDVVDEFTEDRRGKPVGVRGVIMRYSIQAAGTTPPATPEDARYHILSSRSRLALPLPPDSDTKKLYILGQWYNERGELGPVSLLASTTIAA